MTSSVHYSLNNTNRTSGNNPTTIRGRTQSPASKNRYATSSITQTLLNGTSNGVGNLLNKRPPSNTRLTTNNDLSQANNTFRQSTVLSQQQQPQPQLSASNKNYLRSNISAYDQNLGTRSNKTFAKLSPIETNTHTLNDNFKTLYINDHANTNSNANEINSYYKLDTNSKTTSILPSYSNNTLNSLKQQLAFKNDPNETINYMGNSKFTKEILPSSTKQNGHTSEFYTTIGGSASATNSNGLLNSSHKIKSSSSSPSSSTSLQSNSNFYANNNNNNGNSAVNNTKNNYESSGMDRKGIVGLKNLGNTCFMNSILQCLSNTRFLTEYCLQGAYSNDLNTTMSVMKGSLFRSYAALIKTMWKNDDLLVSPQDFKSQIARFAPRFVGYAQQDAEEFLYYLLKGLHEDVNLIKKKPTPVKFDEAAWDRMSDSEKSKEHWSFNLRIDRSRISDMFVGQLKSTLRCTQCDYRSPTFELFWHLAVPIPKQNTSVRLDDCIKLFMAEEILDGDNKPNCSKCKEKRRCTKRYTIEKLPKLLVIHLKRFSKTRYNNKINLNVEYPIENLDMSKYLSFNIDGDESSSLESTNISNNSYYSNSLYDLYGISLHSGTESSGHYIAYSKHPYNRKWYCFNDSLVREIPYNSLQDSSAYILFYQLRS